MAMLYKLYATKQAMTNWLNTMNSEVLIGRPYQFSVQSISIIQGLNIYLRIQKIWVQIPVRSQMLLTYGKLLIIFTSDPLSLKQMYW